MPQNGLEFYEIMKYPIPKRREHFRFGEKAETQTNTLEKFSREQKNQKMEEYTNHIEKYHRLFRSFPFVTNIYICNSITFNALHENSDIDFTIIAKEGRMRTARFFATLYTGILGLKRRGRSVEKKRCLSFWLTKKTSNLYSISIPGIDIYLIYRLAHLVPIYSKNLKEKNILMQANESWLKNFLPNHPRAQTINIGTSVSTGNTKIKKLRENILRGKLGDITENIIKNIRLPIILRKKGRLPKAEQKDIIVNNSIQKFHADKRQKIQRLYQRKTKS